MMSDLKKLVSCRICGGEFSKETLVLNDSPLANELALSRAEALKAEKFPLQVVMCSTCKHFQLKHIVSPDRLFSNYIYKSGTSNFFQEHFKSLAKVIQGIKEGYQLKVLEIGSNDGILLDELKSLGMRCVGLEPSRQLVNECLERGLDVFHGFLNEDSVNELNKNRGAFDVVVGNNVFAHIDDLLGAFRCVNQLLETNGVFIFEVADFSQIRNKGIFDSIYHEHMSFHTVTGLQLLAEMGDFTIEKYSYVDSHGGSFRFFLKKGFGPSKSQEIRVQIEREATLGLNSSVVLSHVQENITRRRIAVSDFIQKREERRILVGYGAPAKAVTFISEMGLENAGIMTILDDNLSKQGRYLPSSGIPITSKEELIRNLRDLKKDEEPLDFMIFPWNLGAELVSKLKAWAPKQSRVITFFPELQVVSL
jgi:2-polyprenyl-3-methyl-5-hydroxy-6-metoxy-1,4-benzoquinol methylase